MEAEQPQQQDGDAIERQHIDGRVLDDEPIVKTSNPYRSKPEYLCPHCCCDITPASSTFSQDDEEGVPAEVQEHIRQCDGLQTYHLGLKCRWRRKARWLAQQRANS